MYGISWRAGRLTTLALSASLLWACGPRGDVIEVEVCGNVDVPEQIDAIRVSVLDAQRNELRAGTRELLLCPEDRLLTLPQVVEFEGVDSADAWVVVQGLKEGVEIMSYERRATLTTSVVEQLTMVLDAECLGVQCVLGQTCIAGECAIVSEQAVEGACEMVITIEDDEPVEMMPEEGDTEEVEEGPMYCPAPPMMSGEQEEA